MNNELLRFYQQELSQLHDQGDAFAKAHPDVAGLLNLNLKKNPDPHMARLIESIAFLNARVSKKLDDTMPRLQQSLLDLIYPHYQQPLPSMAIVQLNGQRDAKPFTVNKATMLETDPSFAQTCLMQTCYDVTVLPLLIKQVEYNSFNENRNVKASSAVKLTLALTNSDFNFDQIIVKPLRFYIDGNNIESGNLFELLVEHTVATEVIQNKSSMLINQKPVPIGFAKEYHILPSDSQSFSGYRLLAEMFCYPEKFRFFDIDLSKAQVSHDAKELTIIFHLNKNNDDIVSINKNQFKLNCTPITNTFSKTLEPIHIDHTQTDYPLVADVRRPTDFAIHHLQQVVALDNDGVACELSSLYSAKSEQNPNETMAWKMERQGHQCIISIADPAGRRVRQSYVLTINALCTNGDLLTRYYQQNPNLALQFNQATGPVDSIQWVVAPTKNFFPSMSQNYLYQLNTHLGLNLTQLLQSDGSQIRSLLQLYNHNRHPAVSRLANTVMRIDTEKTHQRVYRQGLGAICRGLQIKVYLKTDDIPIGQVWLLMKTLENFFSQFSSSNSFVQLVTLNYLTNQEIFRWQAMVGNKPLL